MKRLRFTTLLPALIICACMTSHAQVRKRQLPVDTAAQEVHLRDLLYRNPPENVGLSEEKVFAEYEQQPSYPGGANAMYGFIKANMRTPPAAKKAHVSGRVFLSFMIGVTGEISDVMVLKGIGFGCDAEAVRLVKSMPKWIPGTQQGKPVRVKYNLPILFTNE
ncbi:TonB family C-terminal domain-containing protein [Dyadobacter sp. SG02]|uniref:energy transducer TonB n=1 Tax=Dyadobacter sp. SG02 TaxID=1855291 RepID=UPI0008B1CE2C|nr:energy transducer TonB [Dyadobacter sp. SG02]SEI56612.1 TonB family C-terminal domain-containing protein [Dyadobacter sp. SG02]